MAKKYALLIGITDYEDKRLAQLPAANNDVDDLAKVLLDPKIGAFDEVIIPKDNEKRYDQLRSLIARFFASRNGMIWSCFTFPGMAYWMTIVCSI